MSYRVAFLCSALFVGFLSATTQTFHAPSEQWSSMPMIQQRQGFGVNAGVGVGDFGGFNGGVQVGNPFSSHLLGTIIFGLGMLAFINLVVTLITPLLNKPSSNSTAPASGRALDWNSEDVIFTAKMIMDAVDKLSSKFEQ
jgi:hypothetical protein